MGRTCEFTETEYAAAFWRKVRTVGHPRGCWEWTAAKNEHGYGLTCRAKRMRKAHRQALEFFGVRLGSVFVLHDCDNPACVNPAHLSFGDQRDNMSDCRAKGRTNRGERNGMATKTEALVLEIRRRSDAGERRCSVARALGVSERYVSRIALRERWGYLG